MQELQAKTVEINKVKLSYFDEGPKGAQVLLFIHGFPLNKSMWHSQIAALQTTCRVIAYDVRGHGDSALGEEEYSIALFVKDLLAFMDALQIEKVTLCGLSMGGYIALNAVLNHPKRFEALVLCDTNCMADTPEGVEKRMKTIQNIKAEGLENYANESIKSLFAPVSFQHRTAEIASVRKMVLGTSQLAVFRTLRALASREETCSRLSEIQIPTVVLVGNEDKITPPAAAERIHNGIANSSLVVLQDAGHLSNLENPSRFNEVIATLVTNGDRALQSERVG
jgi:3-oxoadipate enol-lactonase